MSILRVTLGKTLHFTVCQKCSVTQKYARNAFAAIALPRIPLWGSRRSPRPLVVLGGDTTPQTLPSIVAPSVLATRAPSKPGAPSLL